MLTSNDITRALGDIAARERDVLKAYTPGAIPEYSDVAQNAAASFTMDPLSTTAPADSYFITRGEDGRQQFTRDGSFSIHGGELVDSAGRCILGFANGHSLLEPLRADPVDVGLGLASQIRIEGHGLVTYDRATIDPRTGLRVVQRVTIGTIALARFAAGTKLQAIDAQHAGAPMGIVPHVGRPSDGNFGAIAPFARSSSGINIDRGLQRLEDAYLALDAMRAASQAQSGVEKTTMDLLK